MAGKKEKKRRRTRIKEAMSDQARKKPPTMAQQFPLLADGK